jgi:hypothetical protein
VRRRRAGRTPSRPAAAAPGRPRCGRSGRQGLGTRHGCVRASGSSFGGSDRETGWLPAAARTVNARGSRPPSCGQFAQRWTWRATRPSPLLQGGPGFPSGPWPPADGTGLLTFPTRAAVPAWPLGAARLGPGIRPRVEGDKRVGRQRTPKGRGGGFALEWPKVEAKAAERSGAFKRRFLHGFQRRTAPPLRRRRQEADVLKSVTPRGVEHSWRLCKHDGRHGTL